MNVKWWEMILLLDIGIYNTFKETRSNIKEDAHKNSVSLDVYNQYWSTFREPTTHKRRQKKRKKEKENVMYILQKPIQWKWGWLGVVSPATHQSQDLDLNLKSYIALDEKGRWQKSFWIGRYCGWLSYIHYILQRVNENDILKTTFVSRKTELRGILWNKCWIKAKLLGVLLLRQGCLSDSKRSP